MGTKISYKNISGQDKEELRSVRKALRKDVKIIRTEKELKKELRNPANYYMSVTDNGVYAINILRYKKNIFQLLEGNPVTYYFSVAYDVLPQLEDAGTLFLDSYKGSQSEFRWKSPVAFSYIFKVCSIGTIFSFLALEAFMNQCLPDFAKIEYNGKQVTKEHISRFINFESKLKVVIPHVTGKNFVEDHPRKVEVLVKLKKLRDSLTHLKENRKNGFVAYEKLNNEILSIDLKKLINTVKFYINYHQPKTIQNYRHVRNSGKAVVIRREYGEDEDGKFIKQYYEEVVETVRATRFNNEAKSPVDRSK